MIPLRSKMMCTLKAVQFLKPFSLPNVSVDSNDQLTQMICKFQSCSFPVDFSWTFHSSFSLTKLYERKRGQLSVLRAGLGCAQCAEFHTGAGDQWPQHTTRIRAHFVQYVQLSSTHCSTSQQQQEKTEKRPLTTTASWENAATRVFYV